MGFALPILAYHKVDSQRELGLTSISPQRFHKQIRLLNQEGYISVLPRSNFKKNSQEIISGQLDPLSRPLIITFDDGYEGIYKYAYPILREYRFTAIVFVTTGYIGKYNIWDASPGPRFKHLSWTQIREMAQYGILFGSHGVNHKFLTQRKDKEAKSEIGDSKRMLEDRLGMPVNLFSYPYGDYDKRIMSLVGEAGYNAAFSLRPEIINTESLISDNFLYKLPRIAIYTLDNMRAFKAKIGCFRNGSLSYGQKLKNRVINRCAYASMLVEKLRKT